jgi:hypothetical protein
VSALNAGRSAAASLALLTLGLWQLTFPGSAGAQSAWTPVDGEASVSLIYQNLDFGGHFDGNGERLEGAVPSRAHLGILQVEYALTDRLALTARLPYVASKFTGDHHEPVTTLLRERYEEFRRTNPDAAVSNLDTGDYYATFQDFNFTLRYNLLDRGLTVTPVIGAIIPSHHYRTVGEAAPGQDLLALQTGVTAGRLLDPWLPKAYVHGRYTYSFVQRLLGIRLDRSSAELEVGYAVAPTVAVRALANWMHTHGGVPFEVTYEDVYLFLAHDRLLASRYWHAGGGATVSLTDSIDLDGALVTFLTGSDTHYGLGLNIGLTWRFLHGGSGRSATLSTTRK